MKENKVAKIIKNYAIVNFVLGIVVSVVAGSNYDLGFLVFLVGAIVFAVVSFGIYAFGEIIQLLEDIKNNTNKPNEIKIVEYKENQAIEEEHEKLKEEEQRKQIELEHREREDNKNRLEEEKRRADEERQRKKEIEKQRKEKAKEKAKSKKEKWANNAGKSVYGNIVISTATLIIRRITSNYCSGEKVDLLIDGERMCDMTDSQENEFTIYVGMHTIGIERTINGEKNLTEFDINIDDNDTYAFEYMIADGGKIININS